jgi:hypothetical protein
MSKKADISVNTIVMAALALMVLIILLFIFRNQISNVAGGFTSVGNNAKAGAEGTNCLSMLGGRACGKAPNGYHTVGIALEKPCLVYTDPKDVSKGCSKSGWKDCSAECYEIAKND